ncbi:MAG: HEAT repeat domain-containing protein [Phycisphaerales bacterium]|nr:MAG: HEAT repeat domain-containing protein [Phycisphaerales bacterium]
MFISSAAVLLGILLAPGPIPAQASAGSVRLAHSTHRDLLMRYDVELELSARAQDGACQVLGTQRCQWTGYVVGAGRADDVECVQMLVVDPPLKSPDEPLARAVAHTGVRLSVEPWSGTAVEWMRPDADAEIEEALRGLWAWCRWPSRPIIAGQEWETSLGQADSVWHWVFKVEPADKSVEEAEAVVRFQGSCGDPVRLLVEGEVVWDTEDDLLIRAEAVGQWSRDRGHRVLRLRADRESAEVAALTERAKVRGSFSQAVRVAAAYRAGEYEQASTLARRFLQKYAHSPWRPVAESIAGPADEQAALRLQEHPEGLARTLSRLVVAWQESASGSPGACPNDIPELAELAGRFRALAMRYRTELISMAVTEDQDRRAMAAFALGFSDDPATLALLYDLAQRPSPRVRAWAVYALSVRADPQTDARLLAGLLSDEDDTVRARACQAVAACLTSNQEVRARVKRLLFARLDDDSNQVRFQAAVALQHFADAEDLARLKERAAHEDVSLIKSRLEAVIARLESGPR